MIPRGIVSVGCAVQGNLRPLLGQINLPSSSPLSTVCSSRKTENPFSFFFGVDEDGRVGNLRKFTEEAAIRLSAIDYFKLSVLQNTDTLRVIQISTPKAAPPQG